MGAIVCGLIDGKSFEAALSVFSTSLAGCAKIALGYAVLRVFAPVLAHSVFSMFLMSKIHRL
jgi:predicted histidine transporter YuiF (NhaC family)